MLKWITEKLGRQDESPATAAGLRAFLAALPVDQPTLALHDIGKYFADATILELGAADCRRALLRLDDAARGFVDELWAGLFGDSTGKVIFDAPWNELVNFQRNLFCGYSYCLKRLPPPDTIDKKGLQAAIQLLSRAMAALVAHKTLMRIRYRDPHPAFWTDTQTLLAYAARYDIARAPIKLYPDMLHQTTLEREYITGLLFEVAPTGNLLPTQLHGLHLILRKNSEHYVLAENYSAEVPFFFNPATGKPPQRWLIGLKPRPGTHFFGPGAAYSNLVTLRKLARANGRVHDWMQKCRIDTPRYVALLDRLVEHWSQNPPQRRNRRDRQSAAIIVTHGLTQVYRMLAYSKFARKGRQVSYSKSALLDPQFFQETRFGAVDAGNQDGQAKAPEQPLTPMEVLRKFELAGDRQLTEQWTVTDSSEGGLGTVAKSHGGWLRAGMLIAFRYEESIDWQVAIVRRVGRTPQGKLSAGLQCLAVTADCARLRLEKAQVDDNWITVGTTRDPFSDAIIIGDEHPALIAAPGTFSPERECVMKTGRSTLNIRFGELLESGVDFDWFSFSQVK